LFEAAEMSDKVLFLRNYEQYSTGGDGQSEDGVIRKEVAGNALTNAI